MFWRVGGFERTEPAILAQVLTAFLSHPLKIQNEFSHPSKQRVELAVSALPCVTTHKQE